MKPDTYWITFSTDKKCNDFRLAFYCICKQQFFRKIAKIFENGAFGAVFGYSVTENFATLISPSGKNLATLAFHSGENGELTGGRKVFKDTLLKTHVNPIST